MMLNEWMSYAVRNGLTADEAVRGAQIVMDDAEYYASHGFDGVYAILRPVAVPAHYEHSVRI